MPCFFGSPSITANFTPSNPGMSFHSTWSGVTRTNPAASWSAFTRRAIETSAMAAITRSPTRFGSMGFLLRSAFEAIWLSRYRQPAGEPRVEDALRDHRVDARVDVDHLSDPEAHPDAAERVGVGARQACTPRKVVDGVDEGDALGGR